VQDGYSAHPLPRALDDKPYQLIGSLGTVPASLASTFAEPQFPSFLRQHISDDSITHKSFAHRNPRLFSHANLIHS
jgi:hypothetical protein